MGNPLPYHTFRKPRRLKSGKKVYKWYYYWLDGDGKQHQRACLGCKSRSEADSYIRELDPPPGLVVLSPQTAPGAVARAVSIREIAENMYIPGSAHVGRRLQLGKSTNINTLAECRHYVRLIIQLWGDLRPEALGIEVVMPYLFQDGHSGKWKNRFLEILGEVFSEASWYGCKIQRPSFQRFAPNSKKADIFTTDELKRLFKPENFPSDLFYLFFLLCLSGGMRLGEVRAVRAKQFIFDRKIIIIDGFCKKDGSRTTYNKKGTPDNPRFRLVYLPDLTLDKMAGWIKTQNISPEDFCFTLDEKPVRQETAETAFYRALQKSGFIPLPEKRERNKRGDGRKRQSRIRLKPLDGRKLVPHSLRYTFVSRMRRELSAVELLPMTGHSSVGMIDYYNRKALDLALQSLPRSGAAAANTLFF
jgi:integrase